jgi:dolichyldiphosphatase
MPSSHAQFVSFFAVYLTLFLLLRHTPHPTTTHTPLSLTHRSLLSLAALLSASAVAASRVYLNYHTPKQVLAGVGVGVVVAVGWFGVVELARRWGLVDWFLEGELARGLRMRDLCITEDLMDAGWARWEERRKTKKRGTANGKKKR